MTLAAYPPFWSCTNEQEKKKPAKAILYVKDLFILKSISFKAQESACGIPATVGLSFREDVAGQELGQQDSSQQQAPLRSFTDWLELDFEPGGR